MSVTIKYKGNTIASANTDTTKTLKTSGKYCEDDITIENVQDGGTEITDGIVVKARNADGYATEVDLYGTDTIYASQLCCGNQNGTHYGSFSCWDKLTKVNLKFSPKQIKSYAFAVTSISEITGLDFSDVESIGDRAFYYTSWEFEAILNKCQTLGNAFARSNITKIKAPILSSLSTTFQNCTELVTAEFGSIGHPVTYVTNNTFTGCTQDNLTVTAYTTSTYKDSLLANIRNGATNATIIIKDSTTGETLVTSTP